MHQKKVRVQKGKNYPLDEEWVVWYSLHSGKNGDARATEEHKDLQSYKSQKLIQSNQKPVMLVFYNHHVFEKFRTATFLPKKLHTKQRYFPLESLQSTNIEPE